MNPEQERTMMSNIFDMIQQQKQLPAEPVKKKKKELSEARREQLRDQLKTARERKKERQNKPKEEAVVEKKIEAVIKEEPVKVEPVKEEPVKVEPTPAPTPTPEPAPVIIQEQPKPELDTPSDEIKKVYISEPSPVLHRNKNQIRNAYYKKYHLIY